MTKLYPGVAFSPQTTLAANLGAADTVIKVADASVFPDAPNFATIGTDEEGETILYAAKADGLLSGCTRGVEGTAKAWQAGAVIARNFTAQDHNDLIAAMTAAQSAIAAAQETADAANVALAAKQDKLTGQSGQVVGFGADGGAQPVNGWSNPNLIINWDFRNPVNRQGQDEYSIGLARLYSIDGWGIGPDCKLTVKDGYINLQKTNIGEWNFEFSQSIEKLAQMPIIITASILYRTTGNFHFFNGENLPLSSGWSLHSTTNIIQQSDNGVFKFNIYGSFAAEQEIDIKAIKLELGEHQTLARQNASGEWEIIDPPNYDLQYALCSLYSPTTGEWVGYQHNNLNLLDNWYFLDLINQRGQTEYTVQNGAYTIDRWRSTGNVTCTDRGILVSDSIFQPIENAEQLDGKVLTFSILTADNHLHSGTAKLSLESDAVYFLSAPVTLLYSKYWRSFQIVCKNVVLEAVKLELGPVQTLARKEGDTWVLSDPPPNKALELAKCQRYQYIANTIGNPVAGFGLGNAVLTTHVVVPIPIPNSLRAYPSVSTNGSFKLAHPRTGTDIVASNINVERNAKDGMLFLGVDGDGLVVGDSYFLIGDNQARIILDANL